MKKYIRCSLLLAIAIVLLFFSKVKAEEQAKPIITKKQKQVIAMVIAAEGASEGYSGLYLIANTIRNRAIKYNKTPYEVVIQKNQYYGLTAKNRIKLYSQVKKDADYLAERIMELPDKTNGAIFFRQISEPRFKWCKVETIRYKRHIFYK